jgi:hypothetical protein
MTTENNDNRKVMTPPHQYRTGKIYTTKEIFLLGGGGGTSFSYRYQAFKILHLGRQSLYIHWLIIDRTSFKCLSLYCMSIAVISVK